MNRVSKETRNRLLKALFLKARKAGIGSDELRDHIAPSIIGRRLSEAGPKEIMKVLEHVSGLWVKRYPASRAGLIEELTDAARARWGDGFEKPLNAFINSNRRAATHYRFLPTKTLKVLKDRIKELNVKDPLKTARES